MTSKSVLFATLVMSAAGLLAGCGLISSPHDRAVRNSPSFKDGYADGCAAATAQGSNYRDAPMRDETLYKADSTYRAGWANGYQTCNPQRTGAMPGSNPIPAPLPSH